MDVVVMVIAAACGAVAGWVFPAHQHGLYSEPEFRAAPASGRRLSWLRAFCVLSGAGLLGAAYRPDFYDFGPATLAAAFLVVLIGVSSTDFDRRRIPNKVTYPAFAAALALCWAWPDRSVQDILLGTAAGTTAAVVLVGLGALLGGGGLGLGVGDGKLMILIGAVVGWPGVGAALLYGILAGGVVAVVLLFTKGRRATFSYGPYLAGGAALVLLTPALR